MKTEQHNWFNEMSEVIISFFSNIFLISLDNTNILIYIDLYSVSDRR